MTITDQTARELIEAAKPFADAAANFDKGGVGVPMPKTADYRRLRTALTRAQTELGDG